MMKNNTQGISVAFADVNSSKFAYSKGIKRSDLYRRRPFMWPGVNGSVLTNKIDIRSLSNIITLLLFQYIIMQSLYKIVYVIFTYALSMDCLSCNEGFFLFIIKTECFKLI